MQKNDKGITLKLGGKCNLKCKHCHNAIIDYDLNPDLIPWLKKNNFSRIFFSGGEPTLYFDLIKKIVIEIGHNTKYGLVTNATLLTDEMINFFNLYNVSVVVSYDGLSSQRDFSYIPNYRKMKDIKYRGLTSVFYRQNGDLFKLSREIKNFQFKYWNEEDDSSFYPNFVHQTKLSPNDDVDKFLAQKYASQYGSLLELDFLNLKKDKNVTHLNVLKNAFRNWREEKKYQGVACFNEKSISVSISGNFLVCPYNPETNIGNIYHDINWKKVEEYFPERCSTCKIRNICKCICVENITENECYIAKVMYKHMCKLMNKYRYSYDELFKIIMSNKAGEK